MQNSKDTNNIHNLDKITARLVALKMLYADDFSDQASVAISPSEFTQRFKVNELYADMLQQDEAIAEPDQEFLSILYTATISNLNDIDKIIGQNLKPGWTLEKIDPVVKSILRLAISELLFLGDIPQKVIIDQYVSLTRDFYEKQEVGFVNALLDKLAKNIRQNTSRSEGGGLI